MRLSHFVRAIREAGGKPTGKAQKAIWNYFENSPDLSGWVDLSEMSSNPAFRGIHFGQIQNAAGALAKKGLVEYDGTSKIRKASVVEAGGEKFQSYLNKSPDKDKKLDPKQRKKVLMTIYKKSKGMGDGMIRNKKHMIMDAADGYKTYYLEDMTDGELLAFARWKGLIR
jgi:hypothetical protein